MNWLRFINSDSFTTAMIIFKKKFIPFWETLKLTSAILLEVNDVDRCFKFFISYIIINWILFAVSKMCKRHF